MGDQKTTEIPAKVSQPAPPTPEKRRLIMLQLEEVYSGKGYANGWTDKRVSDEMSVPLAWVREVREFAYGPEGSNPLLDQYLTASAEIAIERAAIVELRKGFTESARLLRERCDALDGRMREIDALAKRVEREIGR